MKNPIDSIVSFFSPKAGLMRAEARHQLKRFYEAARPSATRTPIRDGGTGDNTILPAAHRLRVQARYLDENHDLAKGVFNDLVNGIIGAGITTEPLIRNKDGSLDVEMNALVRRLWREWQRRPEVTQELDWVSVQRIACRTWLRDGEVFAQKVMGNRKDIQYPSAVPLLLELMEAEMVPLEYVRGADGKNTRLGVERDAWGKAKAFKVFKSDPNDLTTPTAAKLKTIPANRMIHLKFVERISQTRGISVAAPIIIRLDDLKDYEESERIAARVAAALTGFIKRADTGNVTTNSVGERTFEMAPGLIFDNLNPGEDIGLIKSDRPNVQLEEFRKGQLRAVASGTSASYSNIARDYSGSYSSQRQELIVQSGVYGAMRAYFVSVFNDSVYRDFIDMAILSGALDPKKFDIATKYDVEHRASPTPWIDPLKEARADQIAVENGFKSQAQVIKDRFGQPDDVLNQQEHERKVHKEKGLTFAYYDGQIATTDPSG